MLVAPYSVLAGDTTRLLFLCDRDLRAGLETLATTRYARESRARYPGALSVHAGL